MFHGHGFPHHGFYWGFLCTLQRYDFLDATVPPAAVSVYILTGAWIAQVCFQGGIGFQHELLETRHLVEV